MTTAAINSTYGMSDAQYKIITELNDNGWTTSYMQSAFRISTGESPDQPCAIAFKRAEHEVIVVTVNNGRNGENYVYGIEDFEFEYGMFADLPMLAAYAESDGLEYEKEDSYRTLNEALKRAAK